MGNRKRFSRRLRRAANRSGPRCKEGGMIDQSLETLPPRCPDPAIEILHPSFERYRLSSGTVERIGSGGRWTEGPVWLGDARALLWSDIPNNRILRWDEETGAVSVFRKPSGQANGNTRDRQGRPITCAHGGRRRA